MFHLVFMEVSHEEIGCVVFSSVDSSGIKIYIYR